jgi:competence protein ComEA
MNKQERLAGAVLVLTLAVGITVDLLDRRAEPAQVASSGPEVHCAPGVDSSRGVSADGLPLDGGEGPDSLSRRMNGEPAAAAAAGAGTATRQAQGEYRRIDLNTATVEELELLPGLGPKKAAAIVAWRGEHGRFENVEGLLEVKGIGKVTLEHLLPYVWVGE